MVIPFVIWCHFINYFVIRHFKASDTLKFLSKACVKDITIISNIALDWTSSVTGVTFWHDWRL